MKRMGLLLMSGLVFWGVIACSPGRVIQKPEFVKISNVELLDINQDDLTIRVRTLFHNPNPFGCSLENITFSTYIDGQPLGASRVQGAVDIRGNENFELLLDSRLLLESIPGVMFSIFRKPEVEVEVRGRSTMVNALKNMTFSFNPKSRVKVKSRMKDIIRTKLLAPLSETGRIFPPAQAACE
ncbi:LEA type 2 family protein [Syntrophus sp. (in: bacteria)]|jgi:LEA14-like dessication related protein|uniref:LEA type 2 family protein n=1 Tax=Syntrophus sp. (in: bacteria) TaxID=48412 RepID=UPI00345EE1E6